VAQAINTYGLGRKGGGSDHPCHAGGAALGAALGLALRAALGEAVLASSRAEEVYAGGTSSSWSSAWWPLSGEATVALCLALVLARALTGM